MQMITKTFIPVVTELYTTWVTVLLKEREEEKKGGKTAIWGIWD